jgi:four helix bundle protein
MKERVHHRLLVWKESIELVKDVYEATRKFPTEEMYGLSSQMRRAAVSVPSTIAEGAGRSGSVEFRRFLVIARGSLSELDTQTVIARELDFLRDAGSLDLRIERVFSLLGGLIRSEDKRMRTNRDDNTSPLTPHA